MDPNKYWEDPYENFFEKANFRTLDGQRITRVNFCKFYGQCWFLKEESDAMWRIYSDPHNLENVGIKVTSKAGKLLTTLSKNMDRDYAHISAFIGKVTYMDQQKINDIINNPNVTSPAVFSNDNKAHAEMFILKREPYSHEEEVRLMYFSSKDNEKKHDLINFPFDPNDIFEEMIIDPRVEEYQFTEIEKRIKSCGYQGSILKSTIYGEPQLNGVVAIP